jgi:hypothetical protein
MHTEISKALIGLTEIGGLGGGRVKKGRAIKIAESGKTVGTWM